MTALVFDVSITDHLFRSEDIFCCLLQCNFKGSCWWDRWKVCIDLRSFQDKPNKTSCVIDSRPPREGCALALKSMCDHPIARPITSEQLIMIDMLCETLFDSISCQPPPPVALVVVVVLHAATVLWYARIYQRVVAVSRLTGVFTMMMCQFLSICFCRLISIWDKDEEFTRLCRRSTLLPSQELFFALNDKGQLLWNNKWAVLFCSRMENLNDWDDDFQI